ncbi:monocarboxylate transporter 14-like [Tubulanus polymorphus]|uniref:monocarboxylate transporter 14-like n=1 Tax=Tubulanus polymorphus TaxID=672921 RepID=UPI003DA498A0
MSGNRSGDAMIEDEKSNRLETVIIILAGFAAEFIVGGCFVDGILVAEWMDYFHQGSSMTAWLGTVIVGISFCGALFGNLAVKRFGFRKVFFIASVINATAITMTSFAYSFYVAIALRVLAGCGLAVLMNAVGPYLLCRFPNHSAVVQAFRGMGGSGGTFVFPFIINSCLNEYGWRGCCLIIGGISFQQCALGLVFRNWSKDDKHQNQHRNQHPPDEHQESLLGQRKDAKHNLYQLELFKRKMFVAFLVHSFVLCLSVSTIYVHIVSGSKILLEISKEQSRFTLSAIAIALLVGRVVFSIMTKHPRIDTFTLYMILNALLAIPVGVLPFLKGYTAALVASASNGIFLSAFGSLYVLVPLQLFGSECLYMSYSYSTFFSGIGYLLGAPAAGWIYDATGNYAYSFYFCAGMQILSVVIMIPGLIKHLTKKSETKTDDDENRVKKLTVESANYIISVQSLT